MVEYIEKDKAIKSVKNIVCSMSVCMSTEEFKGMNRMRKRVIEVLTELSSAQPESAVDAEFWRKRADYYSDMCSKLIADMGAGVKIEAVKIDETGITFTKKKPSVQPEPKWIPCSELYPEESGKYLITAWDGTFCRTTHATFQKRGSRWELTGRRAYWKVLAWMPLPEPWIGEENENK